MLRHERSSSSESGSSYSESRSKSRSRSPEIPQKMHNGLVGLNAHNDLDNNGGTAVQPGDTEDIPGLIATPRQTGKTPVSYETRIQINRPTDSQRSRVIGEGHVTECDAGQSKVQDLLADAGQDSPDKPQNNQVTETDVDQYSTENRSKGHVTKMDIENNVSRDSKDESVLASDGDNRITQKQNQEKEMAPTIHLSSKDSDPHILSKSALEPQDEHQSLSRYSNPPSQGEKSKDAKSNFSGHIQSQSVQEMRTRRSSTSSYSGSTSTSGSASSSGSASTSGSRSTSGSSSKSKSVSPKVTCTQTNKDQELKNDAVSDEQNEILVKQETEMHQDLDTSKAMHLKQAQRQSPISHVTDETDSSDAESSLEGDVTRDAAYERRRNIFKAAIEVEGHETATQVQAVRRSDEIKNSNEWDERQTHDTLLDPESRQTTPGPLDCQRTLPPQTLRGFVIENPKFETIRSSIEETKKAQSLDPTVPKQTVQPITAPILQASKQTQEHVSEESIKVPTQKLRGFVIDNSQFERYYGMPKTRHLPSLRGQHQSQNGYSKPNVLPAISQATRPDAVERESVAPVHSTHQKKPKRKPPRFINQVADVEDTKKGEQKNREKKIIACFLIAIVIIVLIAIATSVAVILTFRDNGKSKTNEEDDNVFTCDDGTEYSYVFECDGFEHCENGEDEIGCDCGALDRACSSNDVCILSEWFCDGVPDCPDGEDEEDCGLSCGAGQFACHDHRSCVDVTSRCDDVTHCDDASDEWDCSILGARNALLVVSGTEYLPVCTDGWTDEYASITCSSLGYGAFISWNGISASRLDLSTNDAMNATGSDNVTVSYRQTSSCENNEVVTLTCAHNECGTRSPDLSFTSPRARIIQGYTAESGEWPWQIALYYRGDFICGGSLLNSQYVVTAAHCVEFDPLGPESFDVRLGSIKVSEADEHLVEARVESITMHENYDARDNTLQNDIAILKLTSPVEYTDYIRPVCLPTSQDQAFLSSVVCYTTGWGAYDDQARNYPERLQEARMNLIPDGTCARNSYIAATGLYGDVMICAGYQHGYITTCDGDSGGPLVCRDSRDVWILVGVTSWGPDTPDVDCLGISVFTEVAPFVQWINEIIQ